jgi:hypothetical protein
MTKVVLTNNIINEMSIREINRYFRNEDESDKWPICGKFNVTERAIRRVREYRRRGMEINEGLEYYLALESEISNIVNNEKNW